MATSPNYAWAEPDNSSLVKNGAADIRTLGDAIDTSVWNVGFGQAGKNKIINGDFKINQRNFTSVTTSGTFIFDRFFTRTGGDGTATFTPQTFTAGAAPVAGYEGTNFVRIVTAGSTSTSTLMGLRQMIEDVRTFAGQTVTVSFWAKAATGTPSIVAPLSQVFGTGGSTTVTTPSTKQTISTSWARYSFTINVPSISGKTIGTGTVALQLTIGLSVGSDFATDFTSLGIQNNTFDIWGVQVEYGSKATPFQLAGGGDAQSELAMCQRYYWRSSSSLGSQTAIGISGITNSTTNLVGYFTMPVNMRIAPSIVDFSNIGVQTTGSGLTAISAVTFATENTNACASLNFTSSGFTANLFGIVRGTTGSGYIGLSAEL